MTKRRSKKKKNEPLLIGAIVVLLLALAVGVYFATRSSTGGGGGGGGQTTCGSNFACPPDRTAKAPTSTCATKTCTTDECCYPGPPGPPPPPTPTPNYCKDAKFSCWKSFKKEVKDFNSATYSNKNKNSFLEGCCKSLIPAGKSALAEKVLTNILTNFLAIGKNKSGTVSFDLYGANGIPTQVQKDAAVTQNIPGKEKVTGTVDAVNSIPNSKDVNVTVTITSGIFGSGFPTKIGGVTVTPSTNNFKDDCAKNCTIPVKLPTTLSGFDGLIALSVECFPCIYVSQTNAEGFVTDALKSAGCTNLNPTDIANIVAKIQILSSDATKKEKGEAVFDLGLMINSIVKDCTKNDQEAADISQGGLIGGCAGTRYGCCADGLTSASYDNDPCK
jgi:hypothetical protein